MGWVALGRCAGGGGRLSSVLSLSLTSLASSLIFTILCILTLALTLVTLVRAEDIFEDGKSDKEILDNLLLSTRYDKRLLPPVQGTLTVNVSVLLLSLASPDESSLKYEVEFLLQQQWYDPRLRYSNRSQYEFLNAIHHYDDIWLPDTYFIMHGDFKDPLIPVHFALRIYRNGTVNYLMRRHLILSCQGRLNIFPFDDPLCSFAIESISYEQTAITYVWKNDEGTLRKSPSLTSLNAYLIKNQTITCPIKVSWRGTLTVNVSVLLLSLASPDESSLKYEVEFLLQQQWYDPRLRYSNRSQYEFLNAIHHYDDIWLPDTYFIMHGDFKDPLIPVHFALRIYRNGTVNYLMRRHLILSCQGRLNIFPFDDPLCSFAIESISYEQTAITYVWKNDEGTLRKSPSLTSLNAYLIKNQTITCPIKVSWRADGQIMVDYEDEFDEFGDSKCSLCQRRFEEQGNYSCLKVDLIFTRDRAFYFTTVFIPGIILVTSSFITFWLEWNAVPARVMIGVTTMLNFFTTSNGFRSTLPVVSNLTAMNVWDGVCMCFIYASLLEFVCVNYVGRKRPMHNVVYRPGENPVTQRLPAVLSRIGIILASPLKREGGPPTGATTGPNEIVTCTNCGPNPCTHTTTNGCTAELRKKEPPHPIRVAKTIDVIARITFPVAYFMFLTFFFIHYKGTS